MFGTTYYKTCQHFSSSFPAGRVHLTKGQPDPKSDQMWTWPKASSWGIDLTKGQPDPKSDQMSTWPKTSSWVVHLTKGQPHPKSDQMSTLPKASSWEGPLTKCRKVIWKFEHTMKFCSCFTEVFSYERPMYINLLKVTKRVICSLYPSFIGVIYVFFIYLKPFKYLVFPHKATSVTYWNPSHSWLIPSECISLCSCLLRTFLLLACINLYIAYSSFH